MEWRFDLSAVVLLALAIWAKADHVGFCRSRPDGDYALGCVPHFVSCSAHTSFMMRCRRNLYFDVPSSMCLPRWEASSCRGVRYPKPPVVPPTSPPEPGEEVDFCGNRVDGLYNIGCVSTHVLCSRRRTYVMECPGGEVLDTVSRTCMAKRYVPVCGSVPPAQPPPPVTLPVQPEYPTTPLPVQPEYPTTPSPIQPEYPTTPSQPCIPHRRPAFCCTSRPDGYYSFGCSPLYAACVRGNAYLRRCATQFRFDVVTNQCVQKSYVKECTGYGEQVAQTAITSTTITESVSTSVCSGRTDGAYSTGCSPSYFICISGKPIFNRCIKPMMFDIEFHQCRPQRYVRACGGVPPAKEESFVLPAPPPQTPILRMKRPCQRLRNGFFALGCSSRFLGCLDGRSSYHFCPRDRFFDESTLTCATKSLAKPCGYTEPMPYPDMDVGAAP
uniref:Immunosuppressive ovarian message protein n=1 Tax=Ascaris suum TaxID=6253 RepID=B2REF8_ASCSU|nr:immunosuppressive ovarian message protein [Ascaris suum]